MKDFKDQIAFITGGASGANLALHVLLREPALLLGQFALHKVFGVLAQLNNTFLADQLRNDEEAPPLEMDVLFDRHLITIDTR